MRETDVEEPTEREGMRENVDDFGTLPEGAE